MKTVKCPMCGEAISAEQVKVAQLEERLPPGREWAYVHREGGHDLILAPLPEEKPRRKGR